MTNPITPDTVRALLEAAQLDRPNVAELLETWLPISVARERLRELLPALVPAYLDACAERDRLARVLRVEQGDDSAGNPPRGWSHSLDLTDEAGAVIRHVWTGAPGEVYGSPYEGWWFTKVRGLYRDNQPFHETALEAMEAADRAGGSDV